MVPCVAAHAELDHDRRPRRGVLDRVLDEVVEDDRDVLARRVDPGAAAAVPEVQVDVVLGSDGDPALERGLARGGEGERRDRGRPLALAREREQVRHGAREALGLALARLEVAAERVVLGLQARGLEPQAQAGERRAELVGGVGDEVALRGHRAAQAVGHVVEGVGDLAVLAGAGLLGARVEIARLDAPGGGGQAAQRPRQVAREQPRDDQARARARRGRGR